MQFKIFKNKPAFILTLVMTLSFILFSLSTMKVAQAETDSAVWDNYNIISDSGGNFVGIDINNSARGSLSVAIPTGSATVPAVTGEHGAGIGLVTFELGAVNPFESTGLLIQIDRRHATANQGPRIYIEAQDGTLYRFSDGTARNDVFIKEDGTVSSMKSENSHRYTFTSGVCGTLYVPWSVLTSTGTKTPDGTGASPDLGATVAQGTVFTRLHFGLDMRSTGWHGENRATAFGTIATVNVNGAQTTATELLNVAKLTYSIDADNTEADINLSDITKGNKVYARHSISEVFVFDETPQVVSDTISIHSWTRTSAEITVNYVDGEGGQIKASENKIIPYNKTTDTFSYEITPTGIPGYLYKSASTSLSGSLTGNGTVNLVYEEVPVCILTVKYVDKEGNTIKNPDPFYAQYNTEANNYQYNLEPPHVFGYKYVSADKQLEGTLTANSDITLTYELSFDNYEVINDGNGDFAGIDINNPMTGALIADVSSFNAGTGYGLLTVELGRVNPFESTGFLLQFARLNTGNAQVRMFIESENGTLYRFFAGPDAVIPAREDVLIMPDGSISSVVNESSYNRHMFTSNQEGTLYIPWDKVFGVGSNSPIAEGTVFTKFHFGREMRYETSVNKAIALGTIAAVKVNENSVVVEELVNFKNLTYTVDADNTSADVNLENFANGTKVYIRHWANGTHSFDTDADHSVYETTLGIWKLTRMPPQITLSYIDSNGKTIKTSTVAEAVYAAPVSTYDITPPVIVGYNFVSADKPLQGSSNENFEITLTYSLIEYNVTIEFKDENGVTIKQSRIVSGVFGSYHEITADAVEGYTYKEATSPLKFTVTSDKTIVLYYVKNVSGGCSGNSTPIGLVLLFAATIIISIRRLNRNNLR